jgi:hypothetical protein
MALHKGFGSYPLRALAPIAAGAGAVALGGMLLIRRRRPRGGAASG